MSAADTARPRRVLTLLAGLSTVAVCAQAALDLSAGLRLLLALAVAYGLSIGSGVRWGLLGEVVGEEQFILGRSAMNLSSARCRSPASASPDCCCRQSVRRLVLWLATGFAALTVPVLRFGLRDRAPRRVARTGLGETWRGKPPSAPPGADPPTAPGTVDPQRPDGRLRGPLRPVTPVRGPAGCWPRCRRMMTGDLVSAIPHTSTGRRIAGRWLRFLLAAPFSRLRVRPADRVLAVLVAVGSADYSASLSQQEVLVDLTPAEPAAGPRPGVRAPMTAFGIFAILAGALADLTAPGTGITAFAAASLAGFRGPTPPVVARDDPQRVDRLAAWK
jgi:hypothetical protein